MAQFGVFKSPDEDYPGRYHPTKQGHSMTASRSLSFCIAMLVLPLATIAVADEKSDELKRVMGRFEHTYTNKAGTQFRVVKDVFEDHDTVTTYDDVGNVVTAHRSEFKIEKKGPVRVLSFFNSVVTAGPDKGTQRFETNSYIYRAEDDYFIEVWGLLDGDPNQPRVLAWKRIKTP
jgi:hypothetical protein